MTVSELIKLLEKEDPQAVVIIKGRGNYNQNTIHSLDRKILNVWNSDSGFKCQGLYNDLEDAIIHNRSNAGYLNAKKYKAIVLVEDESLVTKGRLAMKDDWV